MVRGSDLAVCRFVRLDFVDLCDFDLVGLLVGLRILGAGVRPVTAVMSEGTSEAGGRGGMVNSV